MLCKYFDKLLVLPSCYCDLLFFRTGMAGVPGTASAIFGAVKDVGANVIMISQVYIMLPSLCANNEASCWLQHICRLAVTTLYVLLFQKRKLHLCRQPCKLGSVKHWQQGGYLRSIDESWFFLGCFTICLSKILISLSMFLAVILFCIFKIIFILRKFRYPLDCHALCCTSQNLRILKMLVKVHK
jgi:GR25 family glycosyltransferase involved in LPS biosynthesis